MFKISLLQFENFKSNCFMVYQHKHIIRTSIYNYNPSVQKRSSVYKLSVIVFDLQRLIITLFVDIFIFNSNIPCQSVQRCNFCIYFELHFVMFHTCTNVILLGSFAFINYFPKRVLNITTFINYNCNSFVQIIPSMFMYNYWLRKAVKNIFPFTQWVQETNKNNIIMKYTISFDLCTLNDRCANCCTVIHRC